MDKSTSTNSSTSLDTSGRFTRVAGEHNVPCKCCYITQDYTDPLWEFPHGDWLCQPCAELAEAMLRAGEPRSSDVFRYLTSTLVSKTGFDL